MSTDAMFECPLESGNITATEGNACEFSSTSFAPSSYSPIDGLNDGDFDRVMVANAGDARTMVSAKNNAFISKLLCYGKLRSVGGCPLPPDVSFNELGNPLS